VTKKDVPMFFDEKLHLTFDDVCLVTGLCVVKSRSKIDLSSHLPKGYSLELPVMTAAMDTITSEAMAKAIVDEGGAIIHHRNQSLKDRIALIYKLKSHPKVQNKTAINGVAVGLNISDQEVSDLIKVGANLICLEVAHAYMESVATTVKRIGPICKQEGVLLMVGNFSSVEGTKWLRDQTGDLVDIVKVSQGGGCFVGDTRILMADGTYKDIKNIKLHEKVINGDGQPVEVKAVRYSGMKKVRKYRHANWHDYSYATSDHRHLSPTQKGSVGWKSLENCEEMLYPSHIDFELQDSFEIDMNNYALARRSYKNGLELKEPLSPSHDLGFLFGAFLGDGFSQVYDYGRKGRNGIRKRNSTARTKWYFGKEEKHLAEKVQNILQEVFGNNSKIKMSKKRNMWVVHCRCAPISRLFSEFGTKTDKHLPHRFYCSNSEYLLGIYEGLIASDGHEEGTRLGFTNTSPHLMELFNFLCISLFEKLPYGRKPRRSTSNTLEMVEENLSDSFEYRINSDHPLNIVEKYNRVNLHSASEELEELFPTYDIEVDCPTHSFIANNVVVHNSACLTRVRAGIGNPTLQAVIDLVESETPYHVVADGGIRNSGALAKALGAGACAGMLGGMLSGTNETPGDIIVKEPSGNLYKEFRGMASASAKKAINSEVKNVEGVSTMVPYQGPVKNIFDQIREGIQSSIASTGFTDLEGFQKEAQFIRVSHSSQLESLPHAKLLKSKDD